MTQTFEEFLTAKHASQYVGIDDDMGEDYADWLAGLDIQEIIDYAEKWHELQILGTSIDELEEKIDDAVAKFVLGFNGSYLKEEEVFRKIDRYRKLLWEKATEDKNAKQD